ncbi:MAG: hypothetical protein ACK56I_05325, partial [bacterium]
RGQRALDAPHDPRDLEALAFGAVRRHVALADRALVDHALLEHELLGQQVDAPARGVRRAERLLRAVGATQEGQPALALPLEALVDHRLDVLVDARADFGFVDRDARGRGLALDGPILDEARQRGLALPIQQEARVF